MMLHEPDSSCPQNCSHHGVCQGNSCACHMHYTGDACDAGNLSYLCVFGSIFYVVALVSICQLFFCMRSEYVKKRSLKDTFRITTQKTLYALTALAAISRGTYFYVVDFIPEPWAENLLSAYYPLFLSCVSLVVCFWAENFHLSDIPCDRPRFLTKSTVSFLFVNFIFYAILTAQFTVTKIYSTQLIYMQYLLDIFKGCFAAFMLIVLIFFLIYGIQVYFKIHGSFRESDTCMIDSRQLWLSRCGLLAEALLQLSIVVRLSLEVGQFLSIEYLSIIEQNSLDVLFRVVELGAALWFPCVLWNVKRPDQLWILNPKTLLSLSGLDAPNERTQLITGGDQTAQRYNSCDRASPSCQESKLEGVKPIIHYSCQTFSNKNLECWICYEGDEPRFGTFVKPCKCRGDTSAVHHKCLQKWLMESQNAPDKLSCGICKAKYNLKQGAVWLPDGIKTTQWLFVTVAIVVIIGFPFFTAWVFSVCHVSYVRVIMVGVTIVVEYACLKFLGITFIGAYRRAKIAAMQILGRKPENSDQHRAETVSEQQPGVATQIQVDVHRT
ncbi:uncharacterized protein LOC135500939 [Lineus longissimus]|uniref:uncharacterized protein LOC135500939 n=1 Tax=Lineus longissimus TaxID=88925 RepID=UPI002B4E2581